MSERPAGADGVDPHTDDSNGIEWRFLPSHLLVIGYYFIWLVSTILRVRTQWRLSARRCPSSDELFIWSQEIISLDGGRTRCQIFKSNTEFLHSSRRPIISCFLLLLLLLLLLLRLFACVCYDFSHRVLGRRIPSGSRGHESQLAREK